MDSGAAGQDAPARGEVSFDALVAALDALPHPTAVLDAAGIPVYLNLAQRLYLGVDAVADVSLSPLTFTHPDDFPLYPQTVEALLREPDRTRAVEVRIRRHDGQYRWHVCSTTALPVGVGRARWLATFVDIEAYRSQESALQAERARADELLALLDTLQSSAPIGFALVDRDFRFQRINEVLAEFDGLPAAEHVGRRVSEIVPDLWPQLHPLYARALDGMSVLDIEVEGETRARPGEKRQWLASYYPVRVRPEEPVAGVGVIVREVTEERRMVNQINQAQKIQAVGQLAGGVAHDFNNLLATVNLTAEHLLRSADEPALRRGLERILAISRSASALTQKLLLFARQEPSAPAAVDVAKTVSRVLDVVGVTLNRGFELDLDLEDCPPALLDPTHLEQVVLNVVVNARDAMPNGGVLGVQACPADRPGRIVLTVSDTGSGMEPEVRDRAVEPFFSTKGPGLGTGLGLSTVHGIVTAVHGELSISSTPGKGTQVRIELPEAPVRADSASDAGPGAPRGRGQRVLVVEDQEALRRAVVDALDQSGYLVVAAESGSAALEHVARGWSPDLVLTDVVMPGMSGPELAARINRICPRVPVRFMSGHPGTLLGNDRGADTGMLPKPFSTEQLLTAVDEALRAVESS